MHTRTYTHTHYKFIISPHLLICSHFQGLSRKIKISKGFFPRSFFCLNRKLITVSSALLTMHFVQLDQCFIQNIERGLDPQFPLKEFSFNESPGVTKLPECVNLHNNFQT